MTQRLNAAQVEPKAISAMMDLQRFVSSSRIPAPLRRLIDMRVSTMNGCAYCVDMHSKDARAAGETEQRLYAVNVWRDTPFFTPQERAALAFAEAVTELGREGVPDAIYDEAAKYFDEREMVDLTIAIVMINGWNRLSVTFRRDVGDYQPVRKAS